MAKKKETNVSQLEDRETHTDHRKRMKEKFLLNGPDIFNDHELLEILLYYALPRIDTNPVAHRLLGTFGSLRNVFEAPPDALMAVHGVGRDTALVIKLCRAMFMRCLQQEDEYINNSPVIASGEDAIRFFRKKYAGMSNEVIMAAFLDNSGRVINSIKLPPGQVNSCRLDCRAITRGALSNGASAVVIAHNHPYGLGRPSDADTSATHTLNLLMHSLQIELFDHVIIGTGGEGFSMRESGMLQTSRGWR